ncbi:hypothetical protein FOA52_012533 [Chlamydomonas sp. UWO 241]|nr:hypothetical protein FOA52_012533 [Chlamydomonas sp. UWO 241]
MSSSIAASPRAPNAVAHCRLRTTRLIRAHGAHGLMHGARRGLVARSGSEQPQASPEPVPPSTSTSKPSGTAVAVNAPLLSSNTQRSAVFGSLSAVSAALGLVALAAPGLLLAVALPGAPASGLDEPFVQIAGATMAISAAVEYCLKDAADNDRLTSLTYQRLMAGCFLKSAGFVAAFAGAGPLWSPLLAASYPTLALASMVASGLVLSQVQSAVATSISNNGSGSLGSRPSDLLPSGLPSSTPGRVYTLLGVIYLGTAAACYGSEALFVTGPGSPITDVSMFLKATWAPGFLLAAVACVVLSDAADRGRLSGGTFRRLNLGLAATEAAYSGVLLPAVLSGAAIGGAQGWSNLVGSVGITAYCAYQYFANAKKK